MGIDARRIVTGRRLLVTAVTVAAVAGGGAATGFAAAQDDDGDGNVPSGTRVTAAQAAQTALKAAPGTVGEIDLGDDGKAVWETELVDSGGTEHEVAVDAGTGKVLEDRTENGDGDDGPDDDGPDDGRDDDRNDDDGDDRGDDGDD